MFWCAFHGLTVRNDLYCPVILGWFKSACVHTSCCESFQIREIIYLMVIHLVRCSVGLSGRPLRSTASWRSKPVWDAPTSSAGSRTTARHWRTAKPSIGWTLSKSRLWNRKRTRNKTDRALRTFPLESKLRMVSFGFGCEEFCAVYVCCF